MNELSGLIFDIQRFSIHDGPGIRTTVFLKGCPQGCLWCHNPESHSRKPQLAFYKSKCIGCGHCLKVCPNGAITSGDNRIDRSLCKVCGACAQVCASGALKIVGRSATVSEIVSTVMRDEPFYKTSGGGVTLSGGEPLYQYEFSRALLRALKEKNLHTAVETSGYGASEKLVELAALTDVFLYDLKVIDPEKHMKYCCVDNSVILTNARKLAEAGADIIFRTPLIPGLNDTSEDMADLSDFIRYLPGEHGFETMLYHNIGVGKYEALGMTYQLF